MEKYLDIDMEKDEISQITLENYDKEEFDRKEKIKRIIEKCKRLDEEEDDNDKSCSFFICCDRENKSVKNTQKTKISIGQEKNIKNKEYPFPVEAVEIIRKSMKLKHKFKKMKKNIFKEDNIPNKDNLITTNKSEKDQEITEFKEKNSKDIGENEENNTKNIKYDEIIDKLNNIQKRIETDFEEGNQ